MTDNRRRTLLYLAVYALAVTAVLCVKRPMLERPLLFAVSLAFLSVGFWGSFKNFYKRFFNIPLVNWLWNILVILAVSSVLPLAADTGFINRCLVSLAFLAVLKSFMIFQESDLAGACFVPIVLIILAPVFMLEGRLEFIPLIFTSFILSGVILHLYFYSRLKEGLNVVYPAVLPRGSAFKKAGSIALIVFFIPAVTIPVFFMLARIRLPVFVVSPYHMSGDFIDYFSDKSKARIDTIGSPARYKLGAAKEKKWLIAPLDTDRIFMHGIMPGKGDFNTISRESQAAGADKDKEAPVAQDTQAQLEAALNKAAGSLWSAGKFLIFILLIFVLLDFLYSLAADYIKNKRLEQMAKDDPRAFIKKAYTIICEALGARLTPRPGSMTAQEYLYVIKARTVDVGLWFEALTDSFQEAMYSDHPINAACAQELYATYRNILGRLKAPNIELPQI